MNAWFAALPTIEKVFLLFAIAGGALFAVRLVLAFVTGGGLSDGDGADLDHADLAGEGEAAHAHDGTADLAFKLLSFQGMTAFFMMFGLVGLALSRAHAIPAVGAVGGGLAAGLLAVWLIGALFALFNRLQSSGTLKLHNAIGAEGTVYLDIPAGGTGKVQVAVQGRLLVLEAASHAGDPVPTATRVRVVALSGASVLVIERLAPLAGAEASAAGRSL
ncbi:MAG: hypothetical protein IPL40_11525 [Proteobacteria bacterium]|nr:hypothetical protein [Pseudomonadota bacterium]